MITIKTSSWATIKQIKHKEHSNRVYRMNNNKSCAIASALIIMHNQFIRHNIIIIIELKYLKIQHYFYSFFLTILLNCLKYSMKKT